MYFYPNALDPARGCGMDEAVLAFSNRRDCPIFAMTATASRWRDQLHSVLCTGDGDGNVRVWLEHHDDLAGPRARSGAKFRHVRAYRSSSAGQHLVTRAKFVRDDLLVTGTNNGDIWFWQLRFAEDSLSSRGVGRGPVPVFSLRYDLMGVHNGAVELLSDIGDILLSSGGNDGKIVGWDISTGLKLGTVSCHPGELLGGDGVCLYSCVVDVLLNGKDGSLISLCRDGNLRLFQLR